MNDDTCPHCGHAWANHDGLLIAEMRCDICGCMWSEPKPPPAPPTPRDLIIDRIAILLYDGIRETCDGYVENFSQYPGCNGVPGAEVVDGRVDFPAFATYVIGKLGLTPDTTTGHAEPDDTPTQLGTTRL